MKYKVFYNPLANNGQGKDLAEGVKQFFIDDELEFLSVIDTKDEDVVEAVKSSPIILIGGDGTINRFANKIDKVELKNDVYYYSTGTGNDFSRDLELEKGSKPILLNEYLSKLPTVFVNGKESKFVNGIGYGIDGYCCEVADKIREKEPNKDINYAGIAIKGLLFHFKPANATVTVDGVEHKYKHVWLAPTMNGRYYGGGMNIAPNQDRKNADGTLSVVVMHGSGKLKTLIVFPSIFKGEHVKHTEMVEILTGKEINVKFDKPCALQIDGETVLNVSEYTAKSNK